MDLIALSKEMFATTEYPKTTTPMQTQITPRQKQRIKINRQEAIRRRRKCLKGQEGVIERIPKSLRNSFNCLPNSQQRNFIIWIEGSAVLVLPAKGSFFEVDSLPLELRSTANVEKQ